MVLLSFVAIRLGASWPKMPSLPGGLRGLQAFQDQISGKAGPEGLYS